MKDGRQTPLANPMTFVTVFSPGKFSRLEKRVKHFPYSGRKISRNIVSIKERQDCPDSVRRISEGNKYRNEALSTGTSPMTVLRVEQPFAEANNCETIAGMALFFHYSDQVVTKSG